MRQNAFLLAAIMALTLAAASCGDAAGNNPAATDDTSSDVTSGDTTPAETDYLETLELKNFDGYEYRIIAQSYDQRPNLPLADEETGEILNDTIIARNLKVEDLLGITIVNMPFENRDEVKTKVRTASMSDEDAYDLVITSINFGINTLITDGCLYDISALPNLDLSQPWWCQSIRSDYEVDGHFYFTSGLISPFYFYTPGFVAYNKTLTDANGIEGLEQTVLDGKWTFDYLKELTVGKAVDLNGDGKLDENDQYPISGASGDPYFLIGFDEKMIGRTADDGFRFNMTDEDFVNKVEALANYYSDKSTFANYSGAQNKIAMKMFQEDRAMFNVTTMNNVITGYEDLPSFREMKSDYGLLPLPKYDENQKNYVTISQPAGSAGVAVPSTCRDAERNSLIMEVMAYLSNDSIRSAAYEKIVKGKGARIEDTEEMLNIIYENIVYDMNYVFDFGGSKTAMTDFFAKNSGDYMSKITAKMEKANAELEKYVSMLEEFN